MLHPDNQHLFSLIESLEERILFDGVPDAVFLQPAQQIDESVIPARVVPAEEADLSVPRQLVLVDAGVKGGDKLLGSILEHAAGNPVH